LGWAWLPWLAVALGPAWAEAPLEPSAGDYQLSDAGHDLEAPLVLAVQSPGMASEAYLGLVEELEGAGLDVWILRLALSAALPEEGADRYVAHKIIPLAAQELREGAERDELALVGHGPGGTLALMAAPLVRPQAVALLGAPLGAAPSALSAWLAERALPAGSVDLGQPLLWGELDVAQLLLGEPVPPLEPLATPLVQAYLGWSVDGPQIAFEEVDCPVLVTAGALDRLAPVEAVRGPSQGLAQRKFVRFGMLRLELEDPGSGDLLRERRYGELVGEWVAGEMRGR